MPYPHSCGDFFYRWCPRSCLTRTQGLATGGAPEGRSCGINPWLGAEKMAPSRRSGMNNLLTEIVKLPTPLNVLALLGAGAVTLAVLRTALHETPLLVFAVALYIISKAAK